MIEASVALLGFGGIVGTLTRVSVNEWSEAYRSRFSNLLLVSVAPLAISFIAVILLHAGIYESITWAIASGCTALLIATASVNSLRVWFSTPVDTPGRMIPRAFLALNVVIASVMALQVWNALFSQSFWPFLVALSLGFFLASLFFIMLLLEPPA